MLTDEERMKLAERWVEVAPSGFKVIVHVGSTCVKASHKLAAHAQKIGAWGIGAMASPFPKVNRIEELVNTAKNRFRSHLNFLSITITSRLSTALSCRWSNC